MGYFTSGRTHLNIQGSIYPVIIGREIHQRVYFIIDTLRNIFVKNWWFSPHCTDLGCILKLYWSFSAHGKKKIIVGYYRLLYVLDWNYTVTLILLWPISSYKPMYHFYSLVLVVEKTPPKTSGKIVSFNGLSAVGKLVLICRLL